MSDITENETVAKYARESVEAKVRVAEILGVPVAVDAMGNLRVMQGVIEESARNQENPTRRVGTATIAELDSFIAHVNRYKEPRTTIWANADRATLHAIYNDNPEGADPSSAGWSDFGALYRCPLSPEWKAWLEGSDQWLTQDAFADWIESRMEDLTGGVDMPQPVEMLEVARNLQIYTAGTFSKKVDPSTGQYSMVCKEEHTSDSTPIPRAFAAALRIFDGGDKYQVELRVRFKLDRGRPSFLYSVHRATELQAAAFGEMRVRVAEETDRPVFAGVPA